MDSSCKSLPLGLLRWRISVLIEAGFGPSVPAYPHNWRLVLVLRTYYSVPATRTLGGSITDREPAGPFTLLARFGEDVPLPSSLLPPIGSISVSANYQAPSTRTECPIVQAFQGGLNVRDAFAGAFEDGRQGSHWLNIRASS